MRFPSPGMGVGGPSHLLGAWSGPFYPWGRGCGAGLPAPSREICKAGLAVFIARREDGCVHVPAGLPVGEEETGGVRGKRRSLHRG
ncbi:hypothetical protein E2C01_085041 [Portunus trituberculatus]|uniref:Uncharacterized protein n=1 Tax=Portunus trituberculatus TaxID=210409 RepID=A0A5B7JCH8_PORTR|nr:hypothetical protein [Portunus trituberculatus]